MRALDAKLLRDLRRLRGQVLAVAAVVASGTALLVMALSALTSLKATTETYYDRTRFADVFAQVTRAPEGLADRIAEIPGVQAVETRIAAFATVDLPGVAEPVTARLVSLPAAGPPLMNRPVIRAGRLAEPGRADEAVLLAPFAEAHGLAPGDRLPVVMGGVRREVTVVGIALSPEHVYAIAPGGLMPDPARFGVIWMGRAALAAAFDLDGAFNDVSLTLLRGADRRAVIAALDRLTGRYGGTGAIPRADQLSNWFLQNELAQLRSQARILPTIFLAVAAFLVWTVLGRMIATERREISLMKAFGYSGAAVGWHYAKFALATAGLGVLAGWALGAALGRYNTELYAQFFTFPFLHYRPSGAEFATSALIGLGAALAGSLAAVWRAIRLPPAEAMRPPLPESFRGAALPDAVAAALDSPTRITLRQMLRAPLRSMVTVLGVALSVGLLVMAMQWRSSIDLLVTRHFAHEQRQDMTLAFSRTRPLSALHDLSRLPGVLRAEPVRLLAADLTAGRITHRGALTGLPRGAVLQVIGDARGWTNPVPAGGVVLGTLLADKLGVAPGDVIHVQLLGGTRAAFPLTVAGLTETWIGTPALLDLDRLNRLAGEGEVLEMATLQVDPEAAPDLYRAIKGLPDIAALMVKERAVARFTETLGGTILIFIGFFVTFACALTVGVIYNAARITLSERGRELATLRVLGFTRGEISTILLGETAILVLLALPLGCVAGYGLVALMASAFETELFRLPFVIPPSAYGWAVLFALGAAIASAALVRRRLDRLDLIAVLKTRE